MGKDVQSSSLQAYVDKVSGKDLLSSTPVAGKITSEKEIPELSATELILSNGVKVVLKPTDYKNDQVLFNAFSPSGTSIYSDIDYQSAANAAMIVGSSGVGTFDPIMLPKLLSGKVVTVFPYINDRVEGLQGSSSMKDLETALQLMHLYFTSPRKRHIGVQ